MTTRKAKPRGWTDRTHGDVFHFWPIARTDCVDVACGVINSTVTLDRKAAREIGKRLIMWADWAEAKHGSKK